MKTWEYILVGLLLTPIVTGVFLLIIYGIRGRIDEGRKKKDWKRRMQVKFNYLRQKYPELDSDELWEISEKQVRDDEREEKERKERRITKLRFEDNYRGPSDSVH